MAQRFAAEGMKLVLGDIERPVLQRAGEALSRGGAEVITVPTDVSLEADVTALAATAFEHFGDVHLVCNNAGVGSRGLPIAELPLEDFEWVLAVNLFGVVHGLRAFLPHLRANDVGHIVNTASTSGLYHLPRMGPYNASKAAVVALSETLRFELAAEGSKVGVSVLCPSWVRTNISTRRPQPPGALRIQPRLRSDGAGHRLQGQAPAAGSGRGRPRRHRRPGVQGGQGQPLLHPHPPRQPGVFDARARRILAGDDPVEPPE